MGETITTSISIQKTLFTQAENVAQHLDISLSELFEIAIENFIANHPSQALPEEIHKSDQHEKEQRVINQGDVYWVQLENLSEIASDIPHPYVVVQENVFNHSRINTVVICALTSNIKRVNMPGNVLLEVDEANLPKQSVVEVSKISSVEKTQLGEYIGSLTEQRINQILAGMRFLHHSFFTGN